MEEFPTMERKPYQKETFKSHFAEFEKCFRELKSELYMKRNEVSKLKTELEQAIQDNHKLRSSLDKLKKNFEENQITMDLFMKKSKDFEPKYYEKRDALIKLELQYKMATSTINVLREDLQNTSMKKAQLLRKVDALEEKHKRDALYNNEISQKLIQLKSKVETVTEDLEKLKKEQHHAADLSEKVDLAQESLQKCEELSKFNQKLKEENIILQEQFITFKAKFEKVNELLDKNSVTKESDLLARVLLSQCKKISSFYKPAMETKNLLLIDLNKHLCQEKETNLKLVQENEQLNNQLSFLKKVITDLQTKLNVYEPKKEENKKLLVESPEVEVIKVEQDDTIINISDNE